MSAQQVEEQDGNLPSTGWPVEPVQAPEPVGPVEVRRNAALGAGVGVAAAAVAIGYLGRAAGSGAPLDWAVCVLMAVLAVVFLRSLFDARTPLLVIDELGVRMRLAHHWRGLPWDAVDTVAVQPRRGLLHDGRVVVRLHHAERAVEGLDRAARRQVALNHRLYGAPLAVPLGLTTRVLGAGAAEIADRVATLSEGRAEVVTLVPATRSAPEDDTAAQDAAPGAAADAAAPAPDAPDAAAPAPAAPAVLRDDIEEVEPPFVTDRAAPRGGSSRASRWFRRSDRPVADEDGPEATEAEEPDELPVDQPVALRRIGEVTSAMTSTVTGVVTEAVTKAVAPVNDREDTDGKVRALARLGDPVAPLVIDDFRPEPAYDPVIGPELSAARTRVGLSVDELAERTRIRPHVIESIEVDDFAPCGGDFYARGHIRTLARVLGKDPVPLLARYEERYASAPVNARTVFEAELATGRVAKMRRTDGGPNWALMVGAVLALVLVWSLVRLLAGNGQEVLQDPPPMLNGSGGIGRGLDGLGTDTNPGRRPAARAAAAKPVATTLSAVGGGTHVVVRDGNGAVVFRGTLVIGEVQRLEVAPPVTVVAQDGSVVQVSLNGRDLGAVGGAPARTARTYDQPTR